MKNLFILSCFLIFSGCASFTPVEKAVKESNELAIEFTHEMSKLYPELGTSLGFSEYDSKGSVIYEKLEEDEQKLLDKFKKIINEKLKTVKNPDLKVDLLVLLNQIDNSIKTYELENKYKILPFAEVSKIIFQNLFVLMKHDATSKNKEDAYKRFRMYVAPPNFQKSFAIGSMEHFNKKVMDYSGAHFYPLKQEVKKYLSDSKYYITGIGKLLGQVQGDEVSRYYQNFLAQIQQYDEFVAKRILPYAREDGPLPRQIYEELLANQGVEYSPEKLISLGQRDFKLIKSDFEKLGSKLSVKYKLKSKKAKDVINFFKESKITSADEILKVYKTAALKLEKIILDNNLVTLPKKELKIRLGTVSESKASSVPHLTTPPLLNNDGKRSEFIIPINENNQVDYDDFSYEHAAMALCAHEGRPGHDLQFSYILDSPISIIRASYAQNSANIEGWALYAEKMVYPYLTDEQKLVALQTRLWRIARYFLDPMVQLGMKKEKDVLNTFKEIAVSKSMAKLEYERYAFEAPAQATGYYHGYVKIRDFKDSLSQKGALNEKCFNDTLVSLGLVPLKFLNQFEKKFDSCIAK